MSSRRGWRSSKSRELTDDRGAAPDLASSLLARIRKERKVAMVAVLFRVLDEQPKLRTAALEELAQMAVSAAPNGGGLR